MCFGKYHVFEHEDLSSHMELCSGLEGLRYVSSEELTKCHIKHTLRAPLYS
jgi:hypothetical protein